MTGWAKDQGTMGTFIKLLGDPRSEFTKALDLVFDDPGAMQVLGNPRCKRFSMYVDDCTIKTLKVAEGDVTAEDTFAEGMLKDIAGTAAFQYPVAAPSRNTATAATRPRAAPSALGALPRARSPGFSASHGLSSSAARPLRSVPHIAPHIHAPSMGVGPRFSEELSDEEPPTIIQLLAAGMMGFCTGSAITFAVFHLYRRMVGTPTSKEEPLLAA